MVVKQDIARVYSLDADMRFLAPGSAGDLAPRTEDDCFFVW